MNCKGFGDPWRASAAQTARKFKCHRAASARVKQHEFPGLSWRTWNQSVPGRRSIPCSGEFRRSHCTTSYVVGPGGAAGPNMESEPRNPRRRLKRGLPHLETAHRSPPRQANKDVPELRRRSIPDLRLPRSTDRRHDDGEAAAAVGALTLKEWTISISPI